jgi:hypothetical protein
MFSLIITIVAIVLVTLLALATFYFGGTAFRQGANEAVAARIINEGQQVNAALSLYEQTKGQRASTMSDLVDAKLLSTPLPGWSFMDDYTYLEAPSQDACLAANKKMHIDLVPLCSDSTYANKSLCCSAAE